MAKIHNKVFVLSHHLVFFTKTDKRFGNCFNGFRYVLLNLHL